MFANWMFSEFRSSSLFCPFSHLTQLSHSKPLPSQDKMLKLIKNKKLTHQDQKGNILSIYSLDFQSNGSRLATSGGDCTVKIWDTHSLYMFDQSQSALLATLHNHTKSVNCARWSRNGVYLASGSDDCYVLVYTLESSKHSIPSNFNTTPNKENWTRSLTLQGHEMDVLDLDWSPSGLLASASIDNNILLWDVHSSIQSSLRVVSPSRRLQGHTSFVKGVAFDPFGIFLASSSADNTVIIWNCNTWAIERQLDEPLRESRDNSIFRRLSWAPDGGSLCVSCATKGGKPIGMVLKRDTWMSVADLVGHDTPTICCRFNHVPLRAATENSDLIAACCVALGDQSGVISVWTTTQNSPLFVIDNMFTGPVLDLSWFSSEDSEMLLAACSMDGTVSLCALRETQAIGGDRCLTTQEFDSHLKMIYGRGEKELISTSQSLLEDPSVARFRNQATHRIVDQNSIRKGEEQTQPRFQQTIVRFKNGKKRIQPAVSEIGVSGSSPCIIIEQPNPSILRSSDLPIPQQTHSPLACTITQVTCYPGAMASENLTASCRVKLIHDILNSPLPLNVSRVVEELSLAASDVCAPKSSDPCLSLVSLRKSDFSQLPRSNSVWECFVSGRVSTVCGTEILLAHKSNNIEGVGIIGTSEGTLVLISLSSGLKLSPPLILGGKILCVDTHYQAGTDFINIFAINSDGDIWLMIYSWKSGLRLQSKTSIRPLLSYLGIFHQAPRIHTAALSNEGLATISIDSPILGVRGQESRHHFQFLPDLQCWRNIGGLKSLLENTRPEETIPLEPTPNLDDMISRVLRPPAGLHIDKIFHRKYTLAAIEDNLLLSISQNSIESTRVWLSKWAVQCCQCGLETRVKLLVSQFLESSVTQAETGTLLGGPTTSWIFNIAPDILGVPKFRLVQEDILPALASTGMYQSLVAEFSDALDLATSNR